MGNRAIIKTKKGHIGLYLHWNGGRDSVEAFLEYCDLKGYRPPEADGYGWARLAQVVGNFFGGTTSVGICEVSGDHDGKYCDNGAYIIEDWKIVGREDFDGPEQNEYDRAEMLKAIDERQPLGEQLGEFLTAELVPTNSLQIGDVVVLMDWSGTVETQEIIGIGKDITVNGSNVKGIPYIGKYGSDSCKVEQNPNNYIYDEFVRIHSRAADKPQQTTASAADPAPVELFINEQLNGIELKFNRRPTEEVRAALKAAGFRWHHKKAVWYAKNNPERMSVAQVIISTVSAQ